MRVSVLCPGPVASEFQSRSGAKLEPAVLAMPAQAVARAGYDGLMKNKPVVLPGLGVRLLVVLLRLVPRNMVRAAVGSFQRQRLRKKR